MTIRDAQAAAWKNKLAKGFNTTDVPLEFCYLNAEVAEAFDAWRKGRTDLGEELADVALFLVALAEMNGIDLQSEIQHKLTKNAGRQYVTGAGGLPVRLDRLGEAPAPVRSSRPITCTCEDFELSKDSWAAANGMCACGHFETGHTREGLHLACTDARPLPSGGEA